jgi:hypothetical protein
MLVVIPVISGVERARRPLLDRWGGTRGAVAAAKPHRVKPVGGTSTAAAGGVVGQGDQSPGVSSEVDQAVAAQCEQPGPERKPLARARYTQRE